MSPLAIEIAETTPSVMAVDSATKELYGYAHPVVDVVATLQRFYSAYVAATAKRNSNGIGYAPKASDVETARKIFEARAS